MSNLYGRLVVVRNTQAQALQTKYPQLQVQAAIKDNYCQRCYAQIMKAWQLPNGHRYCGRCLQFGRVTTQDILVSVPEPNRFPPFENWQWSGQLTAAQMQVVAEINHHQHHHLVWAVTGAGKTEMLFPIIAQALANKQRICIAAPRIDVILEIAPRIVAVFPNIPLVVLYGQAEEPYHYTQLVICTTHQLLNFTAAFDLLVIDEIDAFPFVNNPLLKHTPKRALKATGRLIGLTATPTVRHLLQFQKRSYLPARFHGHPLPRINVRQVSKWRQLINTQQLPALLTKYLQQNKHQCLIFVPTIRETKILEHIIQRHFKTLAIMSVSAQDLQRTEKVQLMRQRKIQYLITTTILERGVTLPDIDVIILGADHPNFTSRSLLQIAGRVGRKISRPTGLVLAIVSQPSWQVLVAQLTIKWLNHQANKGVKHEL
ncbi:helicase-related protein [Periweissella ghanensis]|nr:helicase-related protein [Periweissella ghanensis]MCM0600520.1 DEAD/DEAH box helicase family protein [Periweissella ghanensis]